MHVATSADSALTPRMVLLGALAEAIRSAAGAGDMEAARVAHEAMAKLLMTAPQRDVVVLSDVRARRGGRT
jgi:hypothetical protein